MVLGYTSASLFVTWGLILGLIPQVPVVAESDSVAVTQTLTNYVVQGAFALLIGVLLTLVGTAIAIVQIDTSSPAPKGWAARRVQLISLMKVTSYVTTVFIAGTLVSLIKLSVELAGATTSDLQDVFRLDGLTLSGIEVEAVFVYALITQILRAANPVDRGSGRDPPNP